MNRDDFIVAGFVGGGIFGASLFGEIGALVGGALGVLLALKVKINHKDTKSRRDS